MLDFSSNSSATISKTPRAQAPRFVFLGKPLLKDHGQPLLARPYLDVDGSHAEFCTKLFGFPFVGDFYN